MSNSLLVQHHNWHRLRWQLLWGLMASALPLAARLLFFGPVEFAQGREATLNAFWGGLAAVSLGIVLVRNIGRYPGLERAAAIIPGFSASFGILLVVLLMLRLEYSRWGLAGTYVCAIGIFYLGYSQVFSRRLAIGVVSLPGGVEDLLKVPGVDWVALNSPNQPLSGIQAIAVDLRVDMPVEWERRIADFALAGTPVYHCKHLIESLTGRVELEHLSETSFGTLSPPETYALTKHVTDRIAAAIALVLLFPVLILVAILIKLDSPGPAIFRQRRVGFRGAPFTVFKFRTMRSESHPIDNATDGARNAAITRENDDRITRVGSFLRKTRVDELPQILNVLIGQMSWIGPRPEAEVLSAWYEKEIPFYRYRHVVRPGITGWAQVMQGHVADVQEVRSKLYYDFYYIKNFSLWIDCLIIFRTFLIMVTGSGAK